MPRKVLVQRPDELSDEGLFLGFPKIVVFVLKLFLIVEAVEFGILEREFYFQFRLGLHADGARQEYRYEHQKRVFDIGVHDNLN